METEIYEVKATIRATSKSPQVKIPALSVSGIVFVQKKATKKDVEDCCHSFLYSGYMQKEINSLDVKIREVRKLKQDFVLSMREGEK